MMQWGIEGAAAVTAQLADSRAAQLSAAASSSAPRDFAALLQQGIGELNASVAAAESAMRDLASTKPVQLHDVMISLERARISVQTFVQVRNKLIESYQDLLRMQL